MDLNLSARLDLLDTAFGVLIHLAPGVVRDELRHAANVLLEQMDDAPNSQRAAAIAAHYNELCAASSC